MLYRNKDCESVLCKNFSEKFYDLVKINGYISNHNCISDFIDYLYEFSNFPSTIDYVVRDDKHHEIFCTFDMCGFRYFRIEITFQKDSYVRFVVYRSYDEPAVDVTMKFNVKGFESLFNFSVSQVFHTNEENASEPEQEEQENPEQPSEDAEEQDNPEQTPAEEKVQSTLKYVLSCNKTKLYNLVKAKSPFDLPKLRDTYYEHSKGMHWFTYTSKNSRYVKCSFGSSYGAFLLRVEAFEYDEVFELSFEDLLAFDLVKEVHEKNISEPEQPAEDAEEQENPEQTPAEDAEEPEEEECWSVECSNRTNGKIELTLGSGKNAIKKYYSSYDEMYEDNPEYKESFFNVLSINARLTPLERTVFEAIENSFNLEFEYAKKSRDIIKDEEPDDFGCYSSDVEDSVKYYEELASMEDYKISYLQDLISKAGLDETYQAWLAERKEQETLGASH